MVFCNSCGKPMIKDDYGTNADGSKNPDYCNECYQNGEFTEPNITLEEMITKNVKKMLEKNPRADETMFTGILIQSLPGLKRWNNELENEDLNEENIYKNRKR